VSGSARGRWLVASALAATVWPWIAQLAIYEPLLAPNIDDTATRAGMYALLIVELALLLGVGGAAYRVLPTLLGAAISSASAGIGLAVFSVQARPGFRKALDSSEIEIAVRALEVTIAAAIVVSLALAIARAVRGFARPAPSSSHEGGGRPR
jgi:hypothetical protein